MVNTKDFDNTQAQLLGEIVNALNNEPQEAPWIGLPPFSDTRADLLYQIWQDIKNGGIGGNNIVPRLREVLAQENFADTDIVFADGMALLFNVGAINPKQIRISNNGEDIFDSIDLSLPRKSGRLALEELSIHIPQPIVEIRNPEWLDLEKTIPAVNPIITAHVFGLTRNLLNHNPEIFLFKYSRRSGSRKAGKRKTKKRFVHPTHLDGSKYPGGAFWTGEQSYISRGIFDNSAPEIIERSQIDFRETEFPLMYNPDAPISYKKINIPLYPAHYYSWADIEGAGQRVVGGEINFPIRVADYGQNYVSGVELTCSTRNRIHTPLQSKVPSTRNLYFKLAIGIDNPDYNPDTPQGKAVCPKLFGPMSETFCIYMKKRKKILNNNPATYEYEYYKFAGRIHNARGGIF